MILAYSMTFPFLSSNFLSSSQMVKRSSKKVLLDSKEVARGPSWSLKMDWYWWRMIYELLTLGSLL